MLASVEKVEGGHIACFKRPLKHSIEKVWAALTKNDKLEKWMPNLQVEDLRNGGIIKFNMNDGTGASFDIKIKECQVNSVLEYEWGDGSVGGARAVEQLRLIAIELQMAPIRSAVHIQGGDFMQIMFGQKTLEELLYLPPLVNNMLDDLGWWTNTLKVAREQQ